MPLSWTQALNFMNGTVEAMHVGVASLANIPQIDDTLVAASHQQVILKP